MRRLAVLTLILILLLWQGSRLLPAPTLINSASFSRAIYDRNGTLLRLTLSSDEKYRLWTPLKQISPQLVRATLLKEDRYFWYHLGINPYALVRGFISTYITHQRRIGGSTISMQLARVRFGIDSRDIQGKLKQLAYALLLELRYSKSELLEAYLNLVPYGGNIEGVGAASIIYFGHKSEKLTLSESLALAVIPQSPRRRAPQQDNQELVRARLNLEALWRAESGSTQVALPTHFRRTAQLPNRAPHLVQELLTQNQRQTEVRATLDMHLQSMLESHLKSYIDRHKKFGIKNGAALLVDYRSMEVRALVGSADFAAEDIQGQFDTSAGKRSPGSALKPFIYGLAIDQGLIHPQSMLKDTRLTISAYNPENFDKDYLGPLSATDALVKSRNVPAISLTAQLKAPTLYQFLKNARIEKMREESIYGLSLALGGVEVTLRELVGLYAMLGNGGVLRPLRWRSEDAFLPRETRMLSPEASFLVLEMLKENPRPNYDLGDGHTASASKVSWKTGTSFGFRDAWSVGLVGPYVLGVWIGNADGKPNPAFIGRETAGPLFFNIVDALRGEAGMRYAEVTSSASVNAKKIEVCAVSGMLPGPHCQKIKKSWFIPGRSPIESCSVHRAVNIEVKSGLRACPGERQGVREEVYEFWPSDILTAGIPRRVPPPYLPRCGINAESGRAPIITSPQRTLIYSLQSGTPLTIPFSAVTDSDSIKTYWFVDSSPVGSVPRGESFIWHASPGEYVVRAIDDLGRANAVQMKVQLVR
jgi:penicillin-binding protein 1C